MLNNLKTYNVIFRKDAKDPLETVEIVPNGFNLWAFVFTGLWCIANKCWRALAFLAIIFSLIIAAEYLQLVNNVQANILSLAISIWFGFEANNYKLKIFEENEYSTFTVVTGFNEDDALRRFYDKFIPQQNLV